MLRLPRRVPFQVPGYSPALLAKVRTSGVSHSKGVHSNPPLLSWIMIPPPVHVSRLIFSVFGGAIHYPTSTQEVYNYPYPPTPWHRNLLKPPKTQ